MKSLQGQFLVASPRLRDPNFFRAVVLLVQHSAEGALGLVLNSPLEIAVEAAWKQISAEPCGIEGTLYSGGPCEGPLMAVHTVAEQSQIEVLPGLHFSTDRDAIERLVVGSLTPVRLFVGYSGWGPKQLEGELKEGAWMVVDGTAQHVFDQAGHDWRELLRLATRQWLSQYLPPDRIPEDPTVN